MKNIPTVKQELLSRPNCPAVTIKDGSVLFNVHTIRKLDECSHIQILMHQTKKMMIIKPCTEDEKDSVQWSRTDKCGKVVSRRISGKSFTTQLYNDMEWDINNAIEVLGTLLKCGDEKMFVFRLTDVEE